MALSIEVGGTIMMSARRPKRMDDYGSMAPNPDRLTSYLCISHYVEYACTGFQNRVLMIN